MIETLHIEKMVFGGDGMAHHDGRTFFVADAAVGETVKAEVYGTRAQCFLAQVTEVIKPSPDRVIPFCQYAFTCGGCQWQHIRYEAQIAYKKEIFADSLRRLGKILGAPEPEVICGPPVGYRHRAQFKIDHEKKCAGFFMQESHDVVKIDSCPLLTAPLNGFLASLNASLPVDIGEIKAIAGTDGSIASAPALAGLSTDQTKITVAGKEFSISGGGFFQQNMPLLEQLGTWADSDLRRGNCLDLYGGVGFFSVMHGAHFDRITLVESASGAVELAGVNAAVNGLSGFTAVADTAESYLKEHKADKEKLDCIMIDPPRSGVSRTVREGIAKRAPRQILYISCDPPTQARDVGYFVNEEGYEIRKTALFDLYPHTFHLETGILLQQG